MSKIKKYSCNEDFFANDNPASCFWAGFISADGNICKKKDSNSWALTIVLKYSDKHHLEKFLQDLNSNHKIYDYEVVSERPSSKGKIFKYSRLSICSNKLCIDLENRFNITPRKSLTYKFPQRLKNSSLISHFLRGQFDGDGSISLPNHDLKEKDDSNDEEIISEASEISNENSEKRKAVCLYFLGTLDFVSNVKDVFIINNIFTGCISKHKNIYRLSFSDYRSASKILNYLHFNCGNTVLDRKSPHSERVMITHAEAQKLIDEENEKIENRFNLLYSFRVKIENVISHLTDNGTFFSKKNESKEQFFIAGALAGRSFFKSKYQFVFHFGNLNKSLFDNLYSIGFEEYIGGKQAILRDEKTIDDLNKNFGINENSKNDYCLTDYVLNSKYLKDFFLGRLITTSRIEEERDVIIINGSLNFIVNLQDFILKNITPIPGMISQNELETDNYQTYLLRYFADNAAKIKQFFGFDEIVKKSSEPRINRNLTAEKFEKYKSDFDNLWNENLKQREIYFSSLKIKDPKCDGNAYFSQFPSKEQFYLVGILLGFSSFDGNYLTIRSGDERLNKFSDLSFKFENNIYSTNDKKIISDLEKNFSLYRTKNKFYFIPDSILSSEYIFDFYNGRLNAQCSCDYERNIISVSGSLDFVINLHDFLIKNNVVKNYTLIKKLKMKDETTERYEIKFYDENAKSIFEYFGLRQQSISAVAYRGLK